MKKTFIVLFALAVLLSGCVGEAASPEQTAIQEME